MPFSDFWMKRSEQNGKKAQVAVEYLIVVSIALMILTPLIMTSQRSVDDLNREVANLKALNALYKIKEASDIVYSQGAPSRMTIYVSFPVQTMNLSAVQSMLILKLGPQDMITDIVLSMDYNVTLEGVPEKGGMQKVTVKASDGYVNITLW